MLIKIITLIAASLNVVKALKSFNKGRYAEAFTSGFTVLLLAYIGRFYL